MAQPFEQRILITTVILDALTITVGLVAAYMHLNHGHTGMLSIRQLGWAPIPILVIIPILFAAIATKYEELLHRVLRVMLVFGLTLGAFFVFQHMFDSWVMLTTVLIAFIAMTFLKCLCTQNLAIIIGVAGIAALLGLYMSPFVAFVILILSAIYDMIFVYGSSRMARVATEMFHANSVFGLVVPERPAGWWMSTTQALGSSNVMILGSGDIGLPLMFAVSILPTSLRGAIVVSLFTLLGVALLHWLFFRRKLKIPVAALPPIVACTVVGYAIVLLTGL